MVLNYLSFLRNVTAAGSALAVIATVGISPANAEDKSGKTRSSATVVINAPPPVVWKALEKERFSSPDVAYTKMLSTGANHETMEQKFINIPILGSVTAVTKHTKELNKRVDYHLLSSSKFKALEGSWELTPVKGGKTSLKLSSLVDIGVPFSGLFIRSATHKKIQRRLANVKKIAEKDQAQMAATGAVE